MPEGTTVRRLRLVVAALVGAAIALALAGRVTVPVGPFDTTISVLPSISGYSAVRLAPLGTIELDSHDAPVALEVRVEHLRRAEAERIAADPTVLATLEDEVSADVRRGLVRLALQCALVATIGGAAGAAVIARRRQTIALGAAVGLVASAAVGGVAAASFDPRSVSEPRYSGLLTAAPTAVGDLEAVVDRVAEYRSQLTDLVTNVVSLYRTAQSLPTTPEGLDDSDSATIRVLHVSDVHNNPQAFDLMEVLVAQFDVDAVADTGDLTDWGSEPEAVLTDRIGTLRVPYVFVRGNHDSGATEDAVAAQPNAVVLRGDVATVAGLRFWGVDDRRYTPNKDQATGGEAEQQAALRFAVTVDRMVAVDQRSEPIDVVLVHDQRMATRLHGDVPLVLAGHTHEPATRVKDGTRTLVEGSTGGAGLRGLQGEEPEPLTATVLHFDRATHRLVAYDRITVAGLGETGVDIDRHIVEPEA